MLATSVAILVNSLPAKYRSLPLGHVLIEVSPSFDLGQASALVFGITVQRVQKPISRM